jgi:flagellar FliL protein
MARGKGTAAEGGPATSSPRTVGRKALVAAVVGTAVAGTGAWWLLAGPSEDVSAQSGHVEVPAEHGEVVPLEAMSVNLADGYLRVAVALQVALESEEAPEGSAALDAAITLFAGRTTAELSDPAVREALRAELAEHVEEVYEGEVVDVYLTEFVTQRSAG